MKTGIIKIKNLISSQFFQDVAYNDDKAIDNIKLLWLCVQGLVLSISPALKGEQ